MKFKVGISILRMYLIFAFCLILVGCRRDVKSQIEYEIDAYNDIHSQHDFHEWLFEYPSGGKLIVDDGIAYKFIRTYNPFENGNPTGLMISIEDGVSDYYMAEALDDLYVKISERLKKQGKVEAVYKEYECCVIVLLKNDKGYNNVDEE